MSPLLVNLYLDRVDRALWAEGVSVVRYVDDIALVADSSREALHQLECLRRTLSPHPGSCDTAFVTNVAAVPESAFSVREFYKLARVEIESIVDPISLQADATRKAAFKRALGRAVTKATTGIFTHDVEVTFVWLIEESRRYQTHLVADIDNVLKPMLDAVTGPDGLLIDDNQIQSIRASWITPGVTGTGFELTFAALMNDEYLSREGVAFVEFAADRCYILPGGAGLNPEQAAHFVSAYRTGVFGYRELLSLGMPEEDARGILPSARPFPRARLGQFQLRHHTEFDQPSP